MDSGFAGMTKGLRFPDSVGQGPPYEWRARFVRALSIGPRALFKIFVRLAPQARC